MVNSTRQKQSSFSHLELAVLFLLCCFTLFQGIIIPFNEPLADALGYVRVASEIVERHTLTNFGMSAEPGRFFPPVYPAFVALPGFFDEAYRQTLDCYNNKNVSACYQGPLQSLAIMQACLVCGLLISVFSIAKILSGKTSTALLTVIIFKFGSEIDNYMHESLTECFQFAFFSFVILASLALLHRRGVNPAYCLCLGLSFGVLVLTRGSYLYLAYVLFPLLFLIKSRREALPLKTVLKLGGLVCGSFLAVLSVWMTRNILVFGDPALSSGYAPFIFVQRLAYNEMQISEWLAAFVFWFPDIGDNLARQYLPVESYGRLGWDAQDSFYQVGQRDRIEMFAAGAEQVSMEPLLLDRLLPDLFWHCMVTLALSFRAMWAGGYLSVFGLLSAFWALAYLHQINKLWLGGLLAFILFFMAGFHGFFTVSIVRYNELLALFYALCFAIVLRHLGISVYHGVFARMAGKR